MLDKNAAMAGTLETSDPTLTTVTTVDLLKELSRRGGHPGALADAALLCVKKSQDYNTEQREVPPELIVRDNYFPFGLKSYVQMVHTKATRLVSLADAPSTNFESAADTFLDQINYSGFAVYWLRRNAGK